MHRWPTLVSRKMEKFTFFYFFLFLSSFFLFFSFFCFSSFFFEKKKCYFSELMRRGILSFFFFFWIDFGSLKLCLECLSLRIILSYKRNSGVCLMVSLVIFRPFFIEPNTTCYPLTGTHRRISESGESRRDERIFFPPSLSLHRSFVLNDVLMNYSFVLHTALIINVRSKTIKHEHFYRTELHKNP